MPFVGEWKDVKDTFTFKCTACGSTHIKYIKWESSDEAHEDFQYHCQGCNRTWWIEGADF